jgi:hypothetical protein
MAGNEPVIWVRREAKNFRAPGWTLIPLLFAAGQTARNPHQHCDMRVTAPTRYDDGQFTA